MGGCQPTAIHKRRAATTGSHTGNGGTAIKPNEMLCPHLCPRIEE